MAVEGDVGVGEVVHEQELVLAGEVDEALHQLRGRGDAVVGLCGNDDDHDARRRLGASTASAIAADAVAVAERAWTTRRAGQARARRRWIG